MQSRDVLNMHAFLFVYLFVLAMCIYVLRLLYLRICFAHVTPVVMQRLAYALPCQPAVQF